MNSRTERLASLLHLSHEMAKPSQPLAILAEGNTSTRLDDHTFLVKASGAKMESLSAQEIVECRSTALLPLLDQAGTSDAAVELALMNSRVDVTARKPSVEALFHASLLTLPGVEFVGHAHPPFVNSVLCSPQARDFAEKRVFPDEIVCCDVASVFVPYTDPGLRLAREIRERTQSFISANGRPPRLVLLENHGIIALGATVDAVLAALWMAEKAAQIRLGAAALGGPVYLTPEHVARIAGRPDEKIRRNLMNL